jgi:2-oxoisovalerate dehydrogenase E1 component
MGVAAMSQVADSLGLNPQIDWKKVAYLVFASRAIDAVEETKLLPEKKILYQFSARGHDVPQIILGSLLTGKRDSASAYYRSRPLLLSLGLSFEDAFAGPMGKSGGFSDGRDIGVVCNLPKKEGAIVLPMSGDVGSQYTPAAGWAQSIVYRSQTLKDKNFKGCISVVLGGEGSVATNGFWSALTMATTLKLPMLFYIEDNQYALSVPSHFQTPGCNIADNLASFKNLKIFDGNGSDLAETSAILSEATDFVRSGTGPALVRLVVPRLSGHSGQDTQAYKKEELIKEEKNKDPIFSLEKYLVPAVISESEWSSLREKAANDVNLALTGALNRNDPSIADVKKYQFSETDSDGNVEVQLQGGLLYEGHTFPKSSTTPNEEPTRINLVTAIRKTLSHELKTNPKVLVFGEDIGPKGGVHAVTLGLQEEFGEDRVFDTSLSEEGIVGRAVGMAVAGLMPVVEIQFRKYADPATEQLNNCGTMRWRTANRFAAPLVVRIAGGFAKCGDPWHSVSGETTWIHAVGWQVVMPSNAQDAVGLLRSAMRSNNPTIFFEHRHMYDALWARRPYPGDDYVVPFGKATITKEGSAITVVSWGAMVERCEEAAKEFDSQVEVIDLRSLSPWDKESVITSVKKTRRCLIVHEDGMTCGFGGEIAAVVANECFLHLDAPVDRLAVEDIPIPYNVPMMESVVPSTSQISQKITNLLNF